MTHRTQLYINICRHIQTYTDTCKQLYCITNLNLFPLHTTKATYEITSSFIEIESSVNGNYFWLYELPYCCEVSVVVSVSENSERLRDVFRVWSFLRIEDIPVGNTEFIVGFLALSCIRVSTEDYSTMWTSCTLDLLLEKHPALHFDFFRGQTGQSSCR